MKIIITDDHKMFRQSLSILLYDVLDNTDIVEAENGKELLDLLTKIHTDLILLDIDMPVMGGLETGKIILKKYPEIRIIILSMYESDELLKKFIEIGVHGYLMKDSTISEIKEAVKMVMQEGFYYNSRMICLMREMISSMNKNSNYQESELSQIEIYILQHICLEFSSVQIAEKMKISVRKVNYIKKSLLNKTNSKNQIGLVKFALRNNLTMRKL
ncbi:MAG: response regulator transcription factor [Cyclobacteriaceae bacterium]|nr:response regulator transcription factor [Cyclobacteriaceae bacterium]